VFFESFSFFAQRFHRVFAGFFKKTNSALNTAPAMHH